MMTESGNRERGANAGKEDEERRFNQEHYDRLMKGQEAWRKRTMDLGVVTWDQFANADPEAAERIWRTIDSWNQDPPQPALLEGANLRESHLSGADLTHAHLEEAILSKAHLEEAKLYGAYLEEADLSNARLEEAKLYGAHLEEADLTHAHLKEAKLSYAHLEDADFKFASLEGADLSNAHLEDADLKFAHLKGADLSEAHLEGADLSEAHLEGADLSEAHLEGAKLSHAHLEEASLRESNLADVDLRGATGFRLDNNNVRGTRFSARSPDPWSVLRRTYTGPRFAIVLVFLLLFVLPYVAKTIGWVATNRAQTELTNRFQDVRERIVGSLEEGDGAIATRFDSLAAARSVGAAAAEETRAQLQALRLSLDGAGAALQEGLPSKNSPYWDRHRVVELLLNMDRGWLYFVPVVVLLLYNLLRAVITLPMALMREEEERSGYTPAWKRDSGRSILKKPARWWDSWFEAYGWLWPLHRTAFVLLWFAFASLLWHAIDWLFLTPVYLPAGG